MVETEVTVGAVVSVVEDELSKESSEELSDDEEELSVLAVLLSSLLLQEKTVRLKRNMEKMMSICLTWFPNWLFQENPKYNINRFDLQCVWDLRYCGEYLTLRYYGECLF